MNKISETVLQSGLMQEIIKELSPEEVEDLKSYVHEYIAPIDSVAALVKDMMSTESSREKLADDIIKLFTPEGVEEIKKCLEKN